MGKISYKYEKMIVMIMIIDIHINIPKVIKNTKENKGNKFKAY